MKHFDIDVSTIFGGMVGVEYINLKDIEEDLDGAVVIDLLFFRITVAWGTFSE